MFKSTIGFLCLGMIALLSMSNVGGRAKQGGEGNTGAPGDKTYVCSECHSGGNYNISTEIKLEDEAGNPVTSYQPETKYKIVFEFSTISGSNPKGYGFQLLALFDGLNTNAGSLANPSTDAQISTIGSRKYLEHKKASQGNVFTADWTSPAAGKGAVMFYGVGNGNNTNNDPSGDKIAQAVPLFINEASAGISKDETPKLFLFPNPVSENISWTEPTGKPDLNYVIEGINGQKIEIPSNKIVLGQFNVSHLNPGFYVLSARNANGKIVASQSFIKI